MSLMRKLSDEELVVNCQSGDQTAWSELYDRYKKYFENAAKECERLGRDHDDGYSYASYCFMRSVRQFDVG